MDTANAVRVEEVTSGVGVMLLGENGSEVYEPTLPTYDEVFPALPESNVIESQQKTSMGQWTQRMKVNSTVITQVFRVPVEERRYKEINEFGGQGEQAKICADISQKAGAHIEISSAKDQTLTILVTGKQDAVLEARRQIVNALQTEASINVPIPKEHHRFILGKSGKKLKDLELSTTTKISVPRSEVNSDLIRILGTRENIDKARHEIQIISDEQAKLAFERLEINALYHPFISGANNENVARIMEENSVRINIPPRSLNKDELTIAGEKEGVMRAKEIITKIYEEKKRKCQTVSINVNKAQHKYIIGYRGAGIQDILAQTGVSVEVPPTDNPVETITLRGEHDKLGPALTLVYAKANSVVESEVDAPSWLHKYIIGKKGANIQHMMQNSPEVHVEFIDDKIVIKGPPKEVEEARNSLEAMANDLVSRITYEEIKVEPKYHKHIIGKAGANVNRIKQETGVLISIPTNETSNTIRIEGSVQGVATAKKELNELVSKMENECTKEIQIDQRFHRTIIGSKGENIRETRERFNQVNITFPDPGIKSDTVSIRGAKHDVEMCHRYLVTLNKEMVENNHRIEVPIYKQFHKYIIGKGGANIKKIRDETDTKIDLPAEGSDSDTIVITGKRENAELAKERIQAIQNEQANIVAVDIIIPAKFHNSIIGAKGRLIRSIMDECGGVSVRFPPEGGGSDKVTIRGPKDDVDKAKKQLIELSNEKQISSFTAEVRAKPEHHRFLIGKNGGNIKKVRDKTGARIIFPSEKDTDREVIVIIGKKEGVQEAKADLEELIKNLDNIVETKIHVDPKHHRHFVARRGQVLRDIANEYGGVTVSFPRNGDPSDVVVLKGAKDCVEDAKNRVEEIVAELDQMVTIECIIPQRYHRTVMGLKGSKVQNVTQEFDVQIKFPDRDAPRDEEYQENGEIDANGDVGVPTEPDNKPRKSDIIKITGKRENCEKASEALLGLVPVTVEVSVPYDFHRFIIGQKGRDIREMNEKYEVNVSVPPATEQSDMIKISGLPVNVENAKQALQERCEQLEGKKQDQVLRSFQVKVEVDPKYHPKIIGRQGKVISKIRMDHNVQIQFPERNDMAENVITITGYEKSAEAAKEDILKIVSELEGMVSEDVQIDHRVHSRLIGQRGRHIRKIMDDFKVDIRFLRDSDGDPDLVVITGASEGVQDAKDHLLNLEEEYLQEIEEVESMRQYRQSSSRQQEDEKSGDGSQQTGFFVKGGPWEQKAPDTNSTTDFPSFRGAKETPKSNVVWGPRH